MNKPIVITLTSVAHGGKDTVADMMKEYAEQNDQSVLILSYAMLLKAICTRNFDYSDSDKEAGRHILQDFGDTMRGLDEDFFVSHVWHTIDLLRDKYDMFVISDARYDNELGKFPYTAVYPTYNVLITRDNFDNGLGKTEREHSSEQLATNPQYGNFHCVIDNSGNLDNTYEQVKETLETIWSNQAAILDIDGVDEDE